MSLWSYSTTWFSRSSKLRLWNKRCGFCLPVSGWGQVRRPAQLVPAVPDTVFVGSVCSAPEAGGKNKLFAVCAFSSSCPSYCSPSRDRTDLKENVRVRRSVLLMLSQIKGAIVGWSNSGGNLVGLILIMAPAFTTRRAGSLNTINLLQIYFTIRKYYFHYYTSDSQIRDRLVVDTPIWRDQTRAY